MSMSFLKSLHRRAVGINNMNEVVSRAGFVSGGEDKPAIVLPGNHAVVAVFDDFLGDLVADEWATVKGDTGISGGAIASVTNGVYRFTGSETQPVTSEGNIALTTGLVKQWKVNMGAGSMKSDRRLRLSARIKAAVISTTAESGRTHIFCGFSDSGGAEFPAYDTGAGVISNAADVVGFVYSPTSASYSDRWQCVSASSVAGDSGDQLAVPSTAIGPSSNTYTALELEVRSGLSDSGSTAHFWIDGKKVATIDGPVASSTAMTPWIGCWMQDTGIATSFDIDYVGISGSRDTGE